MSKVRRIKFKEREETKGIALHFTETDIPLDDYEKQMKRSGWFSVGYHYLVHRDGSIEEGIEPEQFADPTVKGYRNHVCILIMGQTHGKMNGAQEDAVKNIAKGLNLDIIYVYQ